MDTLFLRARNLFSRLKGNLVKYKEAKSLILMVLAVMLIAPITLIEPQDSLGATTNAQSPALESIRDSYFGSPEFVLNYTLTAYSSTPDQTNDIDPFVTASGKRVHDGIVASNFLPFGTKIKIPDIFGDKVFVVEDRMARRFDNRIDIWMSNRLQALRFGKITSRVVIVND